MNAHPVIAVDGVTVRYGRRVAVDTVSLNVEPGTVYALLGRNGAGKSSLVRSLLGLRRVSAGTISLFGEDVWKHRTTLMQRVGVVPEDMDAPPEMSVRAVADFCSKLYGRWRADSVSAALDRFGIDPKARVGALSKGQSKQFALALALASDPELLVLDDPTLGLDPVARKSLFEEVIADLADRGTTILLTTHDLAGVETIATRVGIMRGGHMILDEEVDTLKARFRRVRFAKPVAQELEQVGLRTARVYSWGSGTEAVVTNFDSVERLTTAPADISPMSLEEIFIAVAGEEGARS